ncbi:uncharacterized protein LOC118205247 [Stegodyphus dumicola]|uniref:uncharacterized protein LOC118205247 n=1 Tax=Stegodyphus dumicola TaxID=202533 RepID=UPI0015AC3B24|nr:uncharacterized protein LOC118205247 [Stegodyphus dumicola]
MVINPPYCLISRIICTNSQLQGCHRYEIQVMDQNKSPELETLYHCEAFLKDNFNIIDARYFRLVTTPNECNYLDELLRTKEFKDILSRSSFCYDVNFANSSQSLLLYSTSQQPSVEDIINSSVDTKSELSNHLLLSNGSSEVKENEINKPTEQQLMIIINRLTNILLNFFEKPHDYSIYHKNIIFQNNIKGVTTKGLPAYVQNMYLIKLYGYIHYAKVKVEILKITHHIEDGTVRVRWRVNGVTRTKVLMRLWKTNSLRWKEYSEEETEWLDGFSVFSVGPDGLIFKHVCDKMIPDDELSVLKQVDLKSRLLGLLGLTPRGPATGNLNALIPCSYNQEIMSSKKLT